MNNTTRLSTVTIIHTADLQLRYSFDVICQTFVFYNLTIINTS